jgi:hypothetical protein
MRACGTAVTAHARTPVAGPRPPAAQTAILRCHTERGGVSLGGKQVRQRAYSRRVVRRPSNRISTLRGLIATTVAPSIVSPTPVTWPLMIAVGARAL